VDRCDLALVMMSQLAGGPGELYPLDRLRMQKAVFLLTQRGTPRWRQLYSYKPYNWGPYSSQLRSDVESLVRNDFAEVEDVPGREYGRYRTTRTGEARAARTWADLTSAERDFIRSVRTYVTHKSFTQLLREVYAAYPEFATASQFSG